MHLGAVGSFKRIKRVYMLGNSSEITTCCFAVHQDTMNRDKGQKVNRKKALQAATVNVPEAIRK